MTRQAVFPFVVGCPRSGTTLLRAMINAHSQIAIPGESHFITRMARERERYERPDGYAAEAFADDILADDRFKLWGLPDRAVRASIADAGPTAQLADAIRALFAAYAAHRGKPLYGDKTPGYVRELPLLAELFPEARFVHIVRDGRDVALSLMDVDWAATSIDTLADFWRTNVDRASEAHAELGAGRYREILYEDLIDDPERVLRGVCTFLELPYEPGMLSYYEHAADLVASLRSAQDHRHIAVRPTKGLRDWRIHMSPEDLSRFESIAGESLERSGYARAGPA